ncbi:MAG: hypothetical protein ABL932_24500, partial [Terricaulis sp.]
MSLTLYRDAIQRCDLLETSDADGAADTRYDPRPSLLIHAVARRAERLEVLALVYMPVKAAR